MKKEIKVLTPHLKNKLAVWDIYPGNGHEALKKYLFPLGVKTYFQTNEEMDTAVIQQFDKDVGIKHYAYAYTEGRRPMSMVRVKTQIYNGKKELFIKGIASHPYHQGEGKATILMDAILKNPEKYLQNFKPDLLTGFVHVDNKASMKFFQKYGEMKCGFVLEHHQLVQVKIDYDALNNKKER